MFRNCPRLKFGCNFEPLEGCHKYRYQVHEWKGWDIGKELVLIS